MFFPEKTCDKNIEIVSLSLRSGWSGRAVLSGISGKTFSKADWANCLSSPHLLFDGVEKNIKTEGRNRVAVKNLAIGVEHLKVVIKRHWPEAGFRQFFRALRTGRAVRNFEAACKLLACGVPITVPLAALQQRGNLLSTQSIYISEYFENSSNLYDFVQWQLPAEPTARFMVKKQLCQQLAVILAMLHKNGFWHRDSKATNFIVGKGEQGEYKVLLVDVDGIKPYFLGRRNCRLRTLWRLGASTLPLPVVTRTDYLRTFIAYCNLTGLEVSQRHQVFRELAACAETKHLRLKTVANK